MSLVVGATLVLLMLVLVPGLLQYWLEYTSCLMVACCSALPMCASVIFLLLGGVAKLNTDGTASGFNVRFEGPNPWSTLETKSVERKYSNTL